VKNCDIGTVEAFLKVFEAINFKLELIDLEVNGSYAKFRAFRCDGKQIVFKHCLH